MFDGFWENVARYPRYFVTIILGIFIALLEWLKPFFSNPLTAIALIGIIISLFAFVGLTLRAMLAL